MANTPALVPVFTGVLQDQSAQLCDAFLIRLGSVADMALSETPLKSLELLNEIKKEINPKLLESFFHIRDVVALVARHTQSGLNTCEKTLRSNAAVYFAQNTSGKIKIGYSKNVSDRMKQLSIGSHDDLVVLAVMSGGSKTESMLHKMFKKDMVSNEWFSASDELMAFIAGINEDEMQPVVASNETMRAA